MNIIAELISKRGNAFRRRRKKMGVILKRQFLIANNLGVLGIDYPNEKKQTIKLIDGL